MSSTGDKLSNVEIGQSGMNKAAENISERAIDIVLNLIKKSFLAQLRLECTSQYDEYLQINDALTLISLFRHCL